LLQYSLDILKQFAVHQNYKADNVIVKKRNEINVSIIHNILLKRKLKLNKSNIDEYYDFWMFIIIC